MQLKLLDNAKERARATEVSAESLFVRGEPDPATLAVPVKHSSAVASPSPLWTFSRPVEPSNLDEYVGAHAKGRSAESRATMHLGILDGSLPRIKGATAQRRTCHEAGSCVCKGRGKDVFFLACALQECTTRTKKLFADKKLNKMLQAGDIVLCFSCEEPVCKPRTLTTMQSHETISNVARDQFSVSSGNASGKSRKQCCRPVRWSCRTAS